MKDLMIQRDSYSGLEKLVDRNSYSASIGSIQPTNHPSFSNVVDTFGNKIGSLEKNYNGGESFKPSFGYGMEIPVDRGGYY